jgi:hypothetical protein
MVAAVSAAINAKYLTRSSVQVGLGRDPA